MRLIKTSTLSLLMLLLFTSFSNCSSAKQTNNNESSKIAMQDFQNNPSFTLGETYFKHWVSGVKGGGAGVTLLIPIEKNVKNTVFDSAYFRGMKTKLEAVKSGYVANFKTTANQKKDIIMSTKKNAEYGNQIPNKANFPFQLKDDECVIRFKEDNTIKYYKIEKIVEKPRDEYPSAPPQR
ncbi:hypothetical protein [Lacinutrix cladophorae]